MIGPYWCEQCSKLAFFELKFEKARCCVCGDLEPKAKTRERAKAWHKARRRNLNKQIAVLRKKIEFWRLMGAKANETQARRDLISLKSKLADSKKAR
jgi:hypothetical protein